MEWVHGRGTVLVELVLAKRVVENRPWVLSLLLFGTIHLAFPDSSLALRPLGPGDNAGLEEELRVVLGGPALPAAGLEERLVKQMEFEKIEVGIDKWRGELQFEEVKAQKVVRRIIFEDGRSPIRQVRLEYDPLGQVRELLLEWGGTPSLLQDQAIDLEDGRVFHFGVTADGVPRVWTEKGGEPPWIFSGYDLIEHILDAEGRVLRKDRFYVTVSHYLSPSGSATPASESFDHDEMIPFLHSLNLPGTDVTVINHDAHPDDDPTGPYPHLGNWARFAAEIKLADEILWVAPLGSDLETHSRRHPHKLSHPLYMI